jgi:hypothetical protein
MDTSIDPALLASMIEALALAWLPKTTETSVAAAHTALAAMQPRDLIEAMLAARMIAAHHASIDSYGRAMLPGLGDGDAIRLRANAVAASRSFDAALRILEKRRAPADKPAQTRRREAPAEVRPTAEDALAGYTAEEIAAAEHALDNDPADLARAEVAQRIPLHRWHDMTMEERRIAYAPSAMLTPVQIAVLGVRIAAANARARASDDK